MSKIVQKFLRAKEVVQDGVRLIGDVLLVEKMPEPEVKIGSGILTAAKSKDKQINGITSNLPIFVRVLLVGPGYYDEEGKDVPLEIQPGNILQVARLSVDFFGTFGNIYESSESGVGITRQDAARMVFKDDAAYQKFFEEISRL